MAVDLSSKEESDGMSQTGAKMLQVSMSPRSLLD